MHYLKYHGGLAQHRAGESASVGLGSDRMSTVVSVVVEIESPIPVASLTLGTTNIKTWLCMVNMLL